jgi:hypothetical protein
MQVMVDEMRRGDMRWRVNEFSGDWVSTIGGLCDVESNLTPRLQHLECHLDIFR